MCALESEPVVIVTGPPGAGKTTTSRLLAEASERAVHLESDRFFRFIASGYVEPWRPESHAQNTVVMGIVARAAAGYADAGFFTIVEGIISPRWFFEPLRDHLREAGHSVGYAILRPSLDVCLRRAGGRASGRLGEPGVIERLWHEFAELGALERHVINTEDQTAERTAEALGQRLRAHELAV